MSRVLEAGVVVSGLILGGCTSTVVMRESGHVFEYGRVASVLEPSVGFLERDGELVGIFQGPGVLGLVAGAGGQVGAAAVLRPAKTDVTTTVSTDVDAEAGAFVPPGHQDGHGNPEQGAD